MKAFTISLLFAGFIDLAYSSCQWSVVSADTIITDLRTPTPLSYIVTDTSISGCATAPSSLIGYYTAVVDGTYYTAAPYTVVYSTSTIVYGSFDFPSLIVTNLVPAETIAVLWTNYIFPGTSSGSGYFELTVAQNALTAPITPTPTPSTSTTSTTSSSSTVPPTPTPTSSSSSPAGAIAGGVVGGVIALLFVVALVWFVKFRNRPPPPPPQEGYSMGQINSPYPPDKYPAPEQHPEFSNVHDMENQYSANLRSE